MLLSDIQIKGLAAGGMIVPFCADQIRSSVTKGGLSITGYDVTLGPEFAVYKPSDKPLSPDAVSEDDIERLIVEEFILPPNGFCLAVTAEYLQMPHNVAGRVCDKSSWARCGLSVQNTNIKFGFQGYVTLELHNQNTRPLRLIPGQAIAEILFERGPICATTYADSDGRYQRQVGVTLPRNG